MNISHLIFYPAFKHILLYFHVSVLNEIDAFTNGSFHVESSIRKSFSQTLDRNHAKLLVLNNELSRSGGSCIMEYRNETRENFADAVKKSICSLNDVRKRSIITLSETGLVPNNENAITQCPSNMNQRCLNLVDNDSTSKQHIFVKLKFNRFVN